MVLSRTSSSTAVQHDASLDTTWAVSRDAPASVTVIPVGTNDTASFVAAKNSNVPNTVND